MGMRLKLKQAVARRGMTVARRRYKLVIRQNQVEQDLSKTFLAATFVLGLMLSATVDYAEANGAAVGAAAQRPYSLQQPFQLRTRMCQWVCRPCLLRPRRCCPRCT